MFTNLACIFRGLMAIIVLAAITVPDRGWAQTAISQAAKTQAAGHEGQFDRSIRPLLKAKCGRCHNATARKGGLDLTSLDGLRRGGESGEPAVDQSLDESLLWIMVDGGDMPPEDSEPLTQAERVLLEKWIASGSAQRELEHVVVTQHDVLPHLYARCVVCHGKRRREADLDLRTVESIRAGGKSGPAVVPGQPADSLLLKRLHAKEMPPPRELIKAGVRPLDASEIETITEWIAQGARKFDIEPDVPTGEPDPLVSEEDRQFWSFQPPVKPPVPQTAQSADLNEIDQFLLRKLKAEQLSFSPLADRRTLIRRVAYDLTGLPPDWRDVKRFRDSQDADWYARMVNHYLDSPRYGEHWGRHWLDLSGYADSEGKRSADPVRQHAWRYRDYVIRAFNSDRPFDRFLVEQIAGDELFDFENAETITPEMMDSLVATGYLRMAPDGTGSDIVDTVEERFEVVADEIEILGSSVMGLTLRCAQCHSHKYDPIPQRDYYRLVAVFQGAYDVYDWLKPTSVAGQSKQSNPTRRYLARVTPAARREWELQREKIEHQVAAVEQRLDDRRKSLRDAFITAQLASLPQELHADLRAMLAAPVEQRTDIQTYLAEKFEKRLTITDAELAKRHPELKQLQKTTQAEVKRLRAEIPPEPLIRALWDRGDPSPTWVFRRGQFTTPGQLVGPGVPSVLTDGRTPFQPQSIRGDSTGRRLAFARWLTNPNHPLTARVLVNRVWYHHFGRGIVESLANFGRTGTPPTHPELLDWLAVSFVEEGWSLKWLHREILMSRAYRQSSQLTDELAHRDPDNRLLSRMRLYRLNAESVRDSLLAVAGKLDLRPFGPPDPVVVRADGLVTSQPGTDGWRRTVYVQQRRKEIPTILETFDLPQMMPNCVRRPNSTVAPQALLLLNNGLVRELSLSMAQRIQREVAADREEQVRSIFAIALSRHPDETELAWAVESLTELTEKWREQESDAAGDVDQDQAIAPETRALANLCHVILNSAEFLFVD